ncbi:cholesterol oxidase substrate-binding domain-containing protein [Fluviispira multicolorata]|uniref:FAD-binding protein n=1 Tax=Fluviispira multicolorata TaxID=2654512 RepID=A0A833JDA0_9BACT|nr:cholesterol oxidase substrate-binding domain-containing protein [Fluviispira multicolorata]KAB8031803.1 FAD-binding protein [Fluviispira multicolorata]
MKNIKVKSSRRKFIANLAKIAALSSSVSTIKSFGFNSVNALQLPNFPNGIVPYLEKFENWSGEVKARALWTYAPKNSLEILQIVNWAKNNNYKVRPKGKMHNWSPLTIANGIDVSSRVILIDTKPYLNKVKIDKSQFPSKVTAETGISMENLLNALEEQDLGLTVTPAPGELTLGGVLAINGHGSAVAAANENSLSLGHSYGSLSNLIISLTAIVLDNESNKYILKKFERSEPNCQAFLVHLGRAFITEVTLQVGKNQRMRCQSIIGIPASEIFGKEEVSKFSFAKLVEKNGRVEAIWFPFTDKPWIKVWSVTDEQKPKASREVKSPYNYPFSDNLCDELAKMIKTIISGKTSITPQFGKLEYFITAGGLEYNQSFDIWGWSKNVLLYVKPSTLRVTESGYVVLTKRSNIQRVLNEFYTYYNYLIEKYRERSIYPINGPVEIRVTGLEESDDIINTSALPPLLSSLKKNSKYSEWDVGIWLNILTFPGTPYSNEFYMNIEQWIFANYSEPYAAVRVEWSKGWAFERNSVWKNKLFIENQISKSFYSEIAPVSDLELASAIYQKYDPYHIFSSPLIESLKI